MTRTVTYVPQDGYSRSFEAKTPTGDPKSSEYSDHAIAKEFAKRVQATTNELIVVSGSKFRVQKNGKLKAEA